MTAIHITEVAHDGRTITVKLHYTHEGGPMSTFGQRLKPERFTITAIAIKVGDQWQDAPYLLEELDHYALVSDIKEARRRWLQGENSSQKR